MPAGALRGRAPENVPRAAAELALARLAKRGAVCIEEDLVRRPDHRPTLGTEQQALAERILDEAAQAGLEPPGLREWAERLETSAERLRDAYACDGRSLHFVGHQANLSVLGAVCRRCDILPEHHHSNVEWYGNSGAPSAGTVLSMEWDKWRGEDDVALVGVGAGLSWGSCLLRFGGRP